MRAPVAGSGTGGPTSSGRVRHDEKITIYLSADELLALEQARVRLRGEYRISADRGRIVREAIAMALEDLGSAESGLVRRLGAQAGNDIHQP